MPLRGNLVLRTLYELVVVLDSMQYQFYKPVFQLNHSIKVYGECEMKSINFLGSATLNEIKSVSHFET